MPFDLKVPDGWSAVPLAELTSTGSVTYGVVQPGADTPAGTPLIRVNNFTGNGLDTTALMRIAAKVESKYERTSLQGGDVLITIVGSVGSVAVVPPSMAGWNIARAVALVRPKSPELSRWIAFCLRSPFTKHALSVAANTTVQTTINLKDLKQLLLPMPPERERLGLVKVLSALDERIDLLRQTNATLESIAQALFKSWFIDFDPVRAKAEGREPEGMDAATAALLPAEFEESALGLIPKGWKVGRLGDVCTNPRMAAKPGKMPSDTLYIGLEHMPRKSIALDGAGVAKGLESGKFWFQRDDVLFGKLRPYFHKVGLAPCRGVCSTDILVLRAKKASALGFVAMHASSEALISHTKQLSNGARMPRTSWHDIEAFQVVLPSEEAIRAFDEVARPMFERLYANIEAARALASTRDSLLPRLISGKLRLPEAEVELEEATA